MARICHEKGCGRVHPRGAISCAQAKELIDKGIAEMNARIAVHRDTCHGCPDAYQHVMNIRNLDNPIPWDQRRIR